MSIDSPTVSVAPILSPELAPPAPDSRAAEIYRAIARRLAVRVAERAKDMTGKFPNIVVQNT